MPKTQTSQEAKYAPPDLHSESRVTIEGVQPQVDGGRFPAKRVVGEAAHVSANIHTDGHNAVAANLCYRRAGAKDWTEVPMFLREPGLDLFVGSFDTDALGLFEFTLYAWIDTFANWSRDTAKKLGAGQDVSLEVKEGLALLESAAAAAKGADKERLDKFGSQLKHGDWDEILHSDQLVRLMRQYGKRGLVRQFEKTLEVIVESPRALYGAWYELFPRSVVSDPSKHGTFQDLIKHLPYVAEMGFDVLYLPPIHPIGTTQRKGPNNSLTASEKDPGSPWAIGSAEGGHKSVNPRLGTLADFAALIKAAKTYDIDVAIDIAFQCSPDHPYVKEHPDWFYHRLDGTIRCAENPPKRYEDIYPLDFECSDWQALWDELTDVVVFWADNGVKVFRVDNPHTKPYPFWQYLIQKVRLKHPDTVFLSEAFARPKVMQYLAKVGFSQSYSYFTWRNNKEELTQYFNELYHTDVVEYLRPNLFANTPDILPEVLQYGGRPAFMLRAALASMLGASYGIYGPVFELCVSAAMPNSEDYFESEKYQVRSWNLEEPHSLRDFIARLNRIRRQNPALHSNRNIKFLQVDNRDMIAFSKSTDDGTNTIVVVVNLDPYHTQSGFLHAPTWMLGVDHSYQVHDLISGVRYFWNGDSNFVSLDPYVCPVHVFKILHKVKTERDFDYFV